MNFWRPNVVNKRKPKVDSSKKNVENTENVKKRGNCEHTHTYMFVSDRKCSFL